MVNITVVEYYIITHYLTVPLNKKTTKKEKISINVLKININPELYIVHLSFVEQSVDIVIVVTGPNNKLVFALRLCCGSTCELV